jgi:hypothetical protein
MVHAEAPEPGTSNTPRFHCVKVTGRESNCIANTMGMRDFQKKIKMPVQDASATDSLAAPSYNRAGSA